MATLTNTNPTFLDMAKIMDPDGSVSAVAEILNETNEGFDEMTFIEGNLPTGHQHSVRTGLPSATWGQLYKGVQPSKGTFAQVVDNTGMLESMSEPDARLIELHRDPAQARLIHDRGHIEAMSQQFYETLFNGTAAQPERFIGFRERYNDLSADNADNIILAADSVSEDTDIHSAWLICWSPQTIFGIVPRNSQVGLQQEDHGKVWLEDGDGNGGRMPVYRSYFRWDCGLATHDWRYAVRLANIDLSTVTDDASTGPNLPFLMNDMIERIPNIGMTRPAFYMSRKLRQKLRKQMTAGVSNSTLTLENVGGLSARKKLYFDEIPVNRCDVLAADETVVA